MLTKLERLMDMIGTGLGYKEMQCQSNLLFIKAVLTIGNADCASNSILP
jgi:hypothetical protein